MNNFWRYLWVYLTPASVAFSIWAADFYAYTALLLLFGFLPLLELFANSSYTNLTEAQEAQILADKRYDWLLYSLVPIQYALLAYFLYAVAQPNPTYATVGQIIAMGLACGVLGINAAHELGHRETQAEQNMSKALLLTSLYMHFFIEHNRGHHKHVSTDQDPASSRLGEPVYLFYFRTIWGSWRSAWQLEAERLNVEKLPFWHNQMLHFQLIQLVFLLGIYFTFGAFSLLAFGLAATFGFLLLETVNYIEHYGLRRAKVGDRYERTSPQHSWNSNHPIGRLLLLELSRHADHHYKATRKYQTLRHFDHSPQMPTGYPGMMLLALLPPLWFWVMHNTMRQQGLLK